MSTINSDGWQASHEYSLYNQFRDIFCIRLAIIRPSKRYKQTSKDQALETTQFTSDAKFKWSWLSLNLIIVTVFSFYLGISLWGYHVISNQLKSTFAWFFRSDFSGIQIVLSHYNKATSSCFSESQASVMSGNISPTKLYGYKLNYNLQTYHGIAAPEKWDIRVPENRFTV